jgi:mRNA-degrading endonuclease toxin of MazEF toxin-antitoxin module
MTDALGTTQTRCSVLAVPKGVGHEQHGERYGVVVQSDVMLPRSVVVVGADVTKCDSCVVSTGGRGPPCPSVSVIGVTPRS